MSEPLNDADPYPWPDGTETECHRCGRRRVCQLLADPFFCEISPEEPNEPAWWCRTCYTDRSDDA